MTDYGINDQHSFVIRRKE